MKKSDINDFYKEKKHTNYYIKSIQKDKLWAKRNFEAWDKRCRLLEELYPDISIEGLKYPKNFHDQLDKLDAFLEKHPKINNFLYRGIGFFLVGIVMYKLWNFI